MCRIFGLHTFRCLSKKRPPQVCDLQDQAIGQNHGDEILPNEDLIAKKTVRLSFALPLEIVVVMLYSSEFWTQYCLF